MYIYHCIFIIVYLFCIRIIIYNFFFSKNNILTKIETIKSLKNIIFPTSSFKMSANVAPPDYVEITCVPPHYNEALTTAPPAPTAEPAPAPAYTLTAAPAPAPAPTTAPPKPGFLSKLFCICTALSAMCTARADLPPAYTPTAAPAPAPAPAPTDAQPKPGFLSIICTALAAMSWKKSVGILIAVVLAIGAFVVVPVMMIIYGVQNNAVICVIPCENSTIQNNTVVCVLPCENCSDIRNKYYVLPTPPIGISVPQAFIGSGVIYLVLEIALVICFIKKDKDTSRMRTFGSLYLIFMILLIWTPMCISIYDSMTKKCDKYYPTASVQSQELKWLLGVSIPYIILSGFALSHPFVIATIMKYCFCMNINIPQLLCNRRS